MLTLIEAALCRSDIRTEPVDRDPGIVALAATLVRSTRRFARSVVAQARAAHGQANETELFSSSSAWPYNPRSR